MKKILTVLLMGFILVGCSSQPQGRFSKLSCEKTRNMMDEKQSFVMYVGSETCESCTDYRKVLIKLFDSHPMLIYYIDIDAQKEDDFRDLVYNYLGSCENLPATYIITEGRVTARQEGVMELGELKLWLLENGIIK